jgi:hypothetical protein
MKFLTTYLAYLALSLCIVSCGGGEEGESSSSTPQITPAPPVTDDLVSNDEFEFFSGYNLTINLVSLTNTSFAYHINICSQFTQNDQTFSVDHDSCRLRAKFTEVDQEFVVTLGAAETQLIAQIWPMTDDAEPINLFWAKNGNNNIWQVVFPE